MPFHRIYVAILTLVLALSCDRVPVPEVAWIPEFVSTDAQVHDHCSAQLVAVLNEEPTIIYECGFYYGLDKGSMTKVTTQNEGRRVTAELEGLQPSTAYIFKAYISNGLSEFCSDIDAFVTRHAPQQPSAEDPAGPTDPPSDPSDSPSGPTDTPETDLPQDDPSGGQDPSDPPSSDEPELISFADPVMKSVCVAAYDTDADGELSKSEAAAVKSLNPLDLKGRYVSSFDEFQYFTSVTSVPAHCFSSQPLRSIKFPAGLKEICNNAFEDCVGLKEMILPEQLTEVGMFAFCRCSNMEKVELPESLLTIEEQAFRGCSRLRSIILPKSLTEISRFMFYGCTSLADVRLPEGLLVIHEGVFASCTSLEEVTVPSNVMMIGNDAFADCQRLLKVHIKPLTPPILGKTVFNDNHSDRAIYVPAASVDAYKADSLWTEYNSFLVAE